MPLLKHLAGRMDLLTLSGLCLQGQTSVPAVSGGGAWGANNGSAFDSVPATIAVDREAGVSMPSTQKSFVSTVLRMYQDTYTATIQPHEDVWCNATATHVSTSCRSCRSNAGFR